MRVRRRAVLAAFLLAGLGTACARRSAEEARALPPIEVRASVEPSVATVGDPVSYRLTVEHVPELAVEIPELEVPGEGLTIADRRRSEPRRVRGRVVEESRLELRPDRAGSYVFPPVTVSYRRPPVGASGAPGAVSSQEVVLDVRSVLPADGAVEDIRDIKPLAPLAPSLWWLPWAVGLAVIAVAAWLWRRWRSGSTRRPAEPRRPPHELALAALEALAREPLDEAAAVRRCFFAVSEVVRVYVERRFAVNATDLTTEEILPRLGGLALAPPEARLLRRLLREADLVKFAAQPATADEARAAVETARQFVEATAAREPEPEASEEAA